MGTARALVVGSTSWPACSWSVSKFLERSAMLTRRNWEQGRIWSLRARDLELPGSYYESGQDRRGYLSRWIELDSLEEMPLAGRGPSRHLYALRSWGKTEWKVQCF